MDVAVMLPPPASRQRHVKVGFCGPTQGTLGAMRVDLIIFDCDGVLVDSERLSHQVLVDLLAEHGVVMSLDVAVERFIGSSTDGFLHKVSALLGGTLPEGFLATFRQRSVQAFQTGLTVVPGVPEMLDALTLPCCVASNGHHDKMRFTLAHTGLAPRFQGRVFSADDVANPKPAPDLFLHAARMLGAEPARCVVVEDSPTGVQAARAAGMRVLGHAGLTPAQRLLDAGAHAVFDDMRRLPKLLGLAPA